MTENQQRAKEYLDQYRDAKQDADYLQRRCDELRARAEGCRSSLGFERGWTGETIERRRRIKSKNKKPKYEIWHEKITAPLPGGGGDPHGKENILFVLALQTKEFEQKAVEVEALRREIESTIDAFCNKQDARLLKYRYMLTMSHQEMAEKLNYSHQHVRHLQWLALEKFGDKLHRTTP